MKTQANLLALLSLSMIVAGSASAATVAHYRFEGTGTIGAGATLADETGLNDATAAISGAGQNGSYGSTFGSTVPLTGAANTSSFVIPDSGQAVGVHGVVGSPNANLSFGAGDSFTIEAWVNVDALTTDALDRHYVVWKKPNATADSNTEWGFNIGGNLSGGNKLELFLGNTGFESNLAITANTWWYVSAAFDNDNDLIRYTVSDGTTLSSQIVTGVTSGAISGLGELVLAGHRDGNGAISPAFGGSIDELRISDRYLETSELLAVPEPASIALIGFGGLLMLRRTRRLA